jgi:hypothetical protein
MIEGSEKASADLRWWDGRGRGEGAVETDRCSNPTIPIPFDVPVLDLTRVHHPVV